jgi:hypothetical protein
MLLMATPLIFTTALLVLSAKEIWIAAVVVHASIFALYWVKKFIVKHFDSITGFIHRSTDGCMRKIK